MIYLLLFIEAIRKNYKFWEIMEIKKKDTKSTIHILKQNIDIFK